MVNSTEKSKQIQQILSKAKDAAVAYYNLTGKPLGITGEIAEYEAAKILGVVLTPARTAGFDGHIKLKGKKQRIQIKGRRFTAPPNPGARVGKLDLKQDWDCAALVFLNTTYDATEIYIADRSALEKELNRPGSVARNIRGQLSISQFKRAAGRKPVWRR